MRGFKCAGRFAQARGNSSFARAFNQQFARPVFFTPFNQRALGSVFARCVGEIPLNGFAEQYRSISTSFSAAGQSACGGDAIGEEESGDASVDQLECVQVSEVPTLFQYKRDGINSCGWGRNK